MLRMRLVQIAVRCWDREAKGCLCKVRARLVVMFFYDRLLQHPIADWSRSVVGSKRTTRNCCLLARDSSWLQHSTHLSAPFYTFPSRYNPWWLPPTIPTPSPYNSRRSFHHGTPLKLLNDRSEILARYVVRWQRARVSRAGTKGLRLLAFHFNYACKLG